MPDAPPAEQPASVEEMLVNELVQEGESEKKGGGRWGSILALGKEKLGKWSSELKKLRKRNASTEPDRPAESDGTASSASVPRPQAESLQQVPPVPPSPPEPKASRSITPATHPASTRGKVVVNRQPNEARRAHSPGLQVVGSPGLLMNLPVDFDLQFRVTTSALRFEQDTPLRFFVQTQRDCRVYMVAHDCEGGAELIVPGEGGADNLVFTSVEAKFPNVGHDDYHMMIESPCGAESIVLIAIGTTAKCDFVKDLRESIKKNAPGQTPGVLEKNAIDAYMARHPKQKDTTWSSAVLNFTTVPKPQSGA